MAGNFGIGIGAFADGFIRGISLGEKLKNIQNENEAEKLRKQALEEARKAREAEIEAETARQLELGPPPGSPAAPPAPGELAQQAQPQPENVPVAQPQAVQARVPVERGLGEPPQPAAPARPPVAGLPEVAAPKAARSTEAAAPQSLPAAGLPQIPGAPTARKAVTPEEARKLAEKKVPSVMEFFQKKSVPKIAELYLAQGNVEKAEAWTKWAEQADSKRLMATWAKAWRATQTGDMEGAADHLFELYKRYDDGVTPLSKEVVKDKDGNITGFNVKLRDDDTGEERSAFIDRDQLLDMGLAALSPAQQFETVWKRKEARDKAAAEAAAEVGKIKLQTQKELLVEDAKARVQAELDRTQHSYNLERDEKKATLDANLEAGRFERELAAKTDALRKAGYSEEFVKGMLPDIIGANQYKRATSPEEARRLAFSDRMKNDPSFARMPPAKQREIIEKDMSLIYGGVQPSAVPSGAGAPPAAGGIGTPPSGVRYLRDKATGQIYKEENGQRVPVQLPPR